MHRVIVALASAILLTPVIASAHQDDHWTGYSAERLEAKTKQHQRKARHHFKKARDHARLAHEYEHNRRTREVAYGRVLSVQPIYGRHGHFDGEYSCVQWSDGYERHRTAWVPTVVGGVLGGALGYHLGEDHERPELGTLAGGLIGAAAGHSVGQKVNDSRHIQVSGPCRPQANGRHRAQPVEYQVMYRYNDRIYRKRMDYDPGEWVRLNVEASPA